MPDFSGDLVTLSSDQERLRQVAGSQPDFAAQPGIAVALARSGASDSQVAAVGGFLRGLQLTTQVQLARQSGIQLDLNDRDRASLTVAGTSFNDVDKQARAQEEAAAAAGSGHRGFLGFLENAANRASSLPGVKQAFQGLDRVADVANTVYREAQPVINPGSVSPESIGADIAQRQGDMQAGGYNPDSVASTIAFASRGKQVFQSLDQQRQQYGVEKVRLAQDYLIDPAGFMDAKLSTAELVKRDALRRDPTFEQIVQDVDARRRSPGRDIASGLNLGPGSTPFKVVSGSTDAIWAFTYDPTLILGKVRKGAQVLKYGIGDFSDSGRIEALMNGNNQVKRGWTLMLDDAKVMRSGTSEEKAAAYARVRSRSPELLPVVDEINGGGLRHGAPIETYDELVDHITGTPALIRLRNGLAAREAPLMPGAVSRWAAARADVTGRLAARGEAKVIDLSKDAAKVIPDEVDGVTPAGADASGLPTGEGSPDAAAIGDAVLKYRSTMRGKIDTLKRKFQLLPEDQFISLTDGGKGAETVRRFAALYMPAGHANALAAQFATASAGERRGVAQAVYAQVVHAAGIPSSKSGRQWLEDQTRRRVELDNSVYDSSGNNLDVIRGGDGEATRRSGLYDSQTNRTFHLPNYRDMRIVAAKLSLRERATFTALESPMVDTTLSGVRTLWLVSPASAVRNAVDNNLSAWSQGVGFKDLAAARLARSSTAAQDIAAGAKFKAMQEVGEDYRPMAGSLRGIWHGAVLSGVRRIEAHIGVKIAPDELMARARELADAQMAGELDDLAAGTRATSGAMGRSVDESRAILQQGYKVTAQRMRIGGYELGGADGANGAKEWGKQLAIRLSTDLGHKVFKAAGGEIPAGTALVDSAKFRQLNDVLGVPRVAAKDLGAHEARHLAEISAGQARDDLVDYMLSDPFTEGRALLERFSTLRDGTKVGDDPAMIRRAAEELADDQIVDMKSLISGPDGAPIQELVDHLSAGNFPTVDFLSTVPDARRPAAVVQPKWVPDLSQGNVASNLIQAIGDAGYHKFVAGPMDWMSTTPIYTVNYARAYRTVEKYLRDTDENYRNLVEPPAEVAAKGAKNPAILDDWHALQAPHVNAYSQQIRESARQHAMDLTVQMVDNPRTRTQLALTSRNFFNFYRAQEEFLRRWTRSLKESPENVRKMQLAVEGGMHAGLVYPDENGELVFAYPGSGLAIQTLAKGLSVFGMGDAVNLPVIPNMTTKLNFLNAGLDRPLLPTVSPVAAIPLRVARYFNGDQVQLLQGQQLAEGNISADRSWYSQFLPSPVYRMLTALSNDEQEGQYASAMRNAVMNAYGDGALPTDATPDDIQAFKDKIRVGVRNHLALRAGLALFLPGAPSTPSEESDASRTNTVERGTFNSMSLKDEFRAMTNRYGYQKAIQVWSESRPDELIYTVSTTQGRLGTGGYLAPTDQVLQWIKDNPELTKKYGSLAAYFAPDAPGDFSADAWKTELELGLRAHKGLDTFYRDIAVKNAETTYYKSRDQRDAAIAVAQAAGDDDKVKSIGENFDAWAKGLKDANPLLVEKWANAQALQAKLAASVTEIDKLTQSPAIKTVDPNGDLAKLLDAWKNKQTFDQTHVGRSAVEVAGKDAVEAGYKDYVTNILTRSPYLTPLYQGVFDKVD